MKPDKSTHFSCWKQNTLTSELEAIISLLSINLLISLLIVDFNEAYCLVTDSVGYVLIDCDLIRNHMVSVFLCVLRHILFVCVCVCVCVCVWWLIKLSHSSQEGRAAAAAACWFILSCVLLRFLPVSLSSCDMFTANTCVCQQDRC